MTRNSTHCPKKGSEKEFDYLTSFLREGAQKLLREALEVEVSAFLSHYADRRDSHGRAEIVRNGYLPKRAIQTGLGDIPIQVPRTRDRGQNGIRFGSNLLPPYLKRSQSLDELLPCLYLKGLSSGDFSGALEAILGPSAKGLSPSSMNRLKEGWIQDLDVFQKRDLSNKRYVYFWVDGVYLEARGDEKQCLLVIIGADHTGKKELVALSGGFRESTLSWKEVLLNLKNRGLEMGPNLCIGDGALGFWKALSEVYGQAAQQRCWVHKTRNVLDKLPDSVQNQAKEGLHKIWQKSDTKEEAEKAFDSFIALYEDKYPKATECLSKDRDELLTFFDFPAAHWRSIRTTNPIESVFATVKHRTIKTKGCLSLKNAEVMCFKLIESAQKRWIRLNKGELYMTDIIKGVKFKNGVIAENQNLMQNQIHQETKCAA